MSLDYAPFDLNRLADNLRNLFTETARSKQLNFEIQVDAKAPSKLIGDSLRLQQILSNLLGNAIKFTERGSVALLVTVKHHEPAQVRLEFRVEDTGIGISREDRDKLFQPFTQVDGSITRRFGGTGLGLAISQSLLQEMGGEFQVDSIPDQGTTFAFELVLGVADANDPSTILPSPQFEAADLASELSAMTERLAGTWVLVAEDNSINRQVISEFLHLSGIHVELANNGEEALEWLQRRRFDAVLMDVHMPVMGGVEATRLIRENPHLADLPVIALTAGVTQEERENCLASGMNEFIGKPINTRELMTALVERINPGNLKNIEARRVATSSENWSDLLRDLPGFDLDNVHMSLGNNRDLFIHLLAAFLEEFSGESLEIPSKISAGDFPAARLMLHKLKGVAGNIGAMELHRACQTLERQLKEDRFEQPALAQWQQSFDSTLVDITKVVDPKRSTHPPSPSADRIDASMLQQDAAELDALLAQNDFVAGELLEKIKAHLPADKHDFYEALAQQVYSVDYEQARTTLKTLAALPHAER